MSSILLAIEEEQLSDSQLLGHLEDEGVAVFILLPDRKVLRSKIATL